MSDLPAQPHLDQARRRAKELLHQARAGDADAVARLAAVAAPLTLSGAQLALAREFGLPSWSALVREIEARTTSIPADVMQFLRFSVNSNIGRAARMLAADASLADSGFPAAVVLGDAGRVRAELRRDPAAAARVDLATGWTALHLACASRFHLDPARAAGLLQVTRLLLDAGADVDGQSGGQRCWRPLECAVTSANSSANNAAIISLLLERGAPVRPETVVASLYAAGGTWCLRMLTDAASGNPAVFTDALIEAVAGSDGDAVAILLAAGADPDAPGRDGRTARRRALIAGDPTMIASLGGPNDDPDDRLLAAIAAGDTATARSLASSDPGVVDRLAGPEREVLLEAAEHGRVASVRLMLELGFPTDTRREYIDDDGATALHAAAWAGSADVVALLLDHGADLSARDARWNSQPLGWALVGSGEQPRSAPDPDWLGTVGLLLDAGATLDAPLDLTEGPTPSDAVLALLRSRGIATTAQDGGDA